MLQKNSLLIPRLFPVSRSSCSPIILVVLAITPPWIGGGLPALSHAVFARGERIIATPPVPLLH
eukprot:scaffold11885_cov31-Attheya_sp.AAC.1